MSTVVVPQLREASNYIDEHRKAIPAREPLSRISLGRMHKRWLSRLTRNSHRYQQYSRKNKTTHPTSITSIPTLSTVHGLAVINFRSQLGNRIEPYTFCETTTLPLIETFDFLYKKYFTNPKFLCSLKIITSWFRQLINLRFHKINWNSKRLQSTMYAKGEVRTILKIFSDKLDS